jgi:hypothetical protein
MSLSNKILPENKKIFKKSKKNLDSRADCNDYND